jgi:hypothetical protein
MEKENTNIYDEIHLIEKCQNEEELNEVMKKIIISNNNINSLNTFSYKITQTINTNENLFKNLILNNTDNIIKMFNNIKVVKDELNKSKRGMDAISSQMLM